MVEKQTDLHVYRFQIMLSLDSLTFQPTVYNGQDQRAYCLLLRVANIHCGRSSY